MPKKLTGLQFNELSLVDAPANKHATVSLYKRDGRAERVVSICKSYMDGDGQTDFRAALREEMERQQIGQILDGLWPLFDALRESIATSIADLSGTERDAKLRENVDAFLERVDAVVANGGVQPSDPSSNPGQEDPMTQKTGTDLQAQVNALTKAVESAGGKIEKADDGSFSVAFNALDTLIAELAKKGVTVEKAEIGKPEIAIAKSEPEEMIDFGGEKIAKSALDPAVLKGIEADRARIAKLEKAAEDQALAKRAEEELPNIVGTPAVKGAILKAVDAIDDEETRKAAQQSLKAANETYEALGKAVGRTTRDTEADSPLAKLNAKAEELRKADTSLTQSAAFTKACEQHPDLYNAHARGGAA